MDAKDKQDLKREWLKPSTLITVLAMGVSIVGAYSSLKNDVNNLGSLLSQQDKRITSIEASNRTDHDLLVELRTDMKVVKEFVTGRK